MTNQKRNIDIFLFIYLIIYILFIFIIRLIAHLIYEVESMLLFFTSSSLVLIICYLFIKMNWFLYICIASALVLFTFIAVFTTIMNRGFYCYTFLSWITTYFFPIPAYIFLVILIIKSTIKRRKKYD